MIPKIFLLLFLLGIVFAQEAFQSLDKGDDTEISDIAKRAVELKVQRDQSIRPNDSNNPDADVWMWSAVAEYMNPLTDPQLAGAAKKGMDLMRRQWVSQRTPNRKQPAVMTAVRVGKRVYFASSAKSNRHNVVYHNPTSGTIKNDVPNPINNALKACWNNLAKEKHFNSAACGEIMAAWAFFKENPTRQTMSGAKFAAYEYKKPDNNPDKPYPDSAKIIDPCGDASSNRWGCRQTVTGLGATFLPANSPIDENVPWPVRVHQQQLKGCAVPIS